MKPILEISSGDSTIYIQAKEEDPGLVSGTSRLDDVVEKVKDSLGKQLTILTEISDTVNTALENGRKSFESAEIEFGISFTAKGSIYVAEAEAEATFKVKLTFKPDKTQKAPDA